MRLNLLLWPLAALYAFPAHAQDAQAAEAQLRIRNDCRLAAQVLTTGQPANKRDWALWRIDDCDGSGPPVLARVWREVAPEPAALGAVIRSSVRLRDRRVYDAVASIARDRSGAGIKRAAALHLLGRWADPGFSLEYASFFDRGNEPSEANGGTRPIQLTFIDHDTQHEGSQPLPATVAQDVLALARNLAGGDSDPRVRDVSGALARWLSSRVAAVSR